MTTLINFGDLRNQTRNYFNFPISWNGRTIQMLCVAASLPLLYLLITRVSRLFENRPPEAPQPAVPKLESTTDTLSLPPRNSGESDVEYTQRIIKDTIYPLLAEYSEESQKDWRQCVRTVLTIINSLPPSILFPQADGPLIPTIQKVLLMVEIKPWNKGWNSSCKMETELGYVRQQWYPVDSFSVSLIFGCSARYANVPAKDEKFLYNVPSEFLTYHTLAEVCEMNRRYGLGLMTPQDDEKLDDFKIGGLYSLFSTQERLAAVSCAFLKHILDVIGEDAFPEPRFIRFLFEMKNREDACRKLIILGDFFKQHYDKWWDKRRIFHSAYTLLFSSLHFYRNRIVSPLRSRELTGREKRLPIELSKIISWMPEKYLLNPGLFHEHLKNDFENIEYDKLVYGSYTHADILEFLEMLSEGVLKINKILLANSSCELLDKTLRAHEHLAPFSYNIVSFFRQAPSPETFQKFRILSISHFRHLIQQRTTWAKYPELSEKCFVILLLSAMHMSDFNSSSDALDPQSNLFAVLDVLKWAPTNLNGTPFDEENCAPLRKYLAEYTRTEKSNPYTFQDLVSFLRKLQDHVKNSLM